MSKKKIEGQTSTATVPKKPLSGFFLYRGEKFEEVKKSNASASIAELTKIISNQWNALDEKEKARFTEMSKREREKYNLEVEKYVKENGPIEKVKRKKKRGAASAESEDKSKKRNQKKKEGGESVQKEEEEGKAKKKVKTDTEKPAKKKGETSEANKKTPKDQKEAPKKEVSAKGKKGKKEGSTSK